MTSVKRLNNLKWQIIVYLLDQFFFPSSHIPASANRKKPTKGKNPPYQSERWLFLLTKPSTLTHPVSFNIKQAQGPFYVLTSISVFFFIKPELVEDDRNPSVRDDETSRDPSSNCWPWPCFGRTLQDAAQDEKRSNGKRCVRVCIFWVMWSSPYPISSNKATWQYLDSTVQHRTEAILGITYHGCGKKLYFLHLKKWLNTGLWGAHTVRLNE